MTKSIFIFVVLVLFNIIAYGQDVIVLKDGSSIESKVLKVDDSNVEYRLWNDNDGPVRTVSFGLVTSIKYESGRHDVFPSAIYIDGDDLHDVSTEKQLSDDYLKLILTPEEFRTFKLASSQFNDARRSRVIGKWHIIPGAVILGLGSLVAVLSESDNKDIQRQTMATGIAVAVGGSALLTIGIFRVAGKKKKMDEAEATMRNIANQYNKRNSAEAVSYSPTLFLGTTNNGFGLVFNF